MSTSPPFDPRIELIVQKIKKEGFDSLTLEELTTLNEKYKEYNIPLLTKRLDKFSRSDSMNRMTMDTFTRPGSMSDGGMKINGFSSLDLKPRIDTYSRPAPLGDGGMPSETNKISPLDMKPRIDSYTRPGSMCDGGMPSSGGGGSGGGGICICIGIVIIIVIVVLLLKFFFHVF